MIIGSNINIKMFYLLKTPLHCFTMVSTSKNHSHHLKYKKGGIKRDEEEVD